MSKTATWVRKEQRSAQYYGLRNDYQWCMSDKTRDPVEALQQAFGDDLDVVTMLALEPKPVDRDWTRFEESMEIVDLGRCLDAAGRTMFASGTTPAAPAGLAWGILGSLTLVCVLVLSRRADSVEVVS